MKEKMMKMMGEKKKLSPMEVKAKTGVLEQLKKDMQDMMGEKVAGLKKVTVASNDPKGLEQGLEKAKEMIHGGAEPDSHLPEQHDESQDMEESEDHELAESPEDEMSEHKDHMAMALGQDEEEGEDEAALDAKIEMLMKKKEMMKKK